MEIGLVHATNAFFSESQNYGLRFAPVWAFTLSQYIKNCGHVAHLYDLDLYGSEVIDKQDVYFISGINQDLPSIISTVEYIRKRYPEGHIFVGGPIAWSFDQADMLSKLSFVDHVCIGDGEILVSHVLDSLERNVELPHIIKVTDRFDLQKSLPMDEHLVKSTYNNYYGAVIEVSRGCPFLCEFCDVRVLPDNNKIHPRNIDAIISDLDLYLSLGIRNIQFACDNFIGDYEWANKLVDQIVLLNEKHGYAPSIYTWLTINAVSHPGLLRKMRAAGFDNLFIGIESFESNALLETAKLQNTKFTIISSIKKIQSFGFIVVAGLIFGFDSDTPSSFKVSLEGIEKTGLLSGDASMLTALPGTPLYRRMMLSGRLREFKHDMFLGGYKYVTNIKYLMPRDDLIKGYIMFSQGFIAGDFQYARLSEYYKIILASDDFVNISRPGYTDVGTFIKKAIKSPKLLKYHLIRLVVLVRPIRLFFLLRAILLSLYIRIRYKVGFQYFFFWLFIWVNSINKYGKISELDFDVESVSDDFDLLQLIPEGYLESANEMIPQRNIVAQYKATVRQLQCIIDNKSVS